MGKLLEALTVLIVHIIVLSQCTDSVPESGSEGDSYCNSQVALVSDDCPEAFQRGKNKVFQIAFILIYSLLESKCGTIIVAPANAYYTTSLIGIYTRINSPAYNQMSDLTGTTSNEEIRCVLQNFNIYYNEQPAQVINLLSDLIVSNCCNNFTNRFICDAEVLLGAKARNYNFRCPIEVKTTVDQIIANQTDNHVQNTVPCSNIFRQNCTAKKLVLASGRYLEPKFKYPFILVGKKDYTDLDNNTYKVDFVRQCGTYNYTNSKKFHVKVAQFYLKYDYILYTLIVPYPGYTLMDTAKSFQDPENYNELMSSLKQTELTLTMPKYDSGTSTYSYVDIFKKEGILSPYFDAETADIRDNNGEYGNVYLAGSFVKIVINNTLDGNGSGGDECTETNRKRINFLVNRPMMYVTTIGGIPNFCGVGKVTTD